MACLITPSTIRNLHLTNRLIMPPMATSKAGSLGEITPALLQYYDEKTRGGYFGLVITEHTFVSAEGKTSANQISSADDDKISGLRQLSDVIHKNGSPVVLQLNHAGSGTKKSVIGSQPVAPSPVVNPSKADMEVPRELTQSEIQNIVDHFASAAFRSKQAGLDGVEIHSCHGYLLDQFLSPITNKRTDEYGGKIENRIRIHLQVLKAVRDAVGNDFLILFRLAATDYMEGGLNIEDSVAAARALENAGADLLDISGGMCRYAIPGIEKMGYFTNQAKAIKRSVSIPVMVTGGVQTAAAAESLLQNHYADLVGVGRAVLHDSDWAKNAIQSFLS